MGVEVAEEEQSSSPCVSFWGLQNITRPPSPTSAFRALFPILVPALARRLNRYIAHPSPKHIPIMRLSTMEATGHAWYAMEMIHTTSEVDDMNMVIMGNRAVKQNVT